MGRLSDSTMGDILGCVEADSFDRATVAGWMLREMVQELRERRALDLTAEEREALEWLLRWDALDGHAPRSETGSAMHKRALAVLSKLTRGAV
jgi:hypothetical protein